MPFLNKIDTCGQCYKTPFDLFYATFSVTSVKILRKRTDSCINYAKKGFMTLTLVGNIVKLFLA